jgi:ATP phosphoribosyltransferase
LYSNIIILKRNKNKKNEYIKNCNSKIRSFKRRQHSNSKDAGISIDNGIDQLKPKHLTFPLEVLLFKKFRYSQYLMDGVVDIDIVVIIYWLKKAEILRLFKIRFSKCKVSVAVPKAFEYKSVKDLDGMRIATSHPKTVLDFFNSKGVTVDIHQISGSVEIAPNIGLADAIVDIVSSGSTLFKNNLKRN